MHTTPSLPSLLRITGLIKVKTRVPGVAELLLQYWSPPIGRGKIELQRRLCVEICILGGTPNPRGQGCGGIFTTKGIYGLRTQDVGFSPKVVVVNP